MCDMSPWFVVRLRSEAHRGNFSPISISISQVTSKYEAASFDLPLALPGGPEPGSPLDITLESYLEFFIPGYEKKIYMSIYRGTQFSY